MKSVNNGALGSYGYDGNGKRVKKTESGTTTYYVYSTFLDAAVMEVNSTGVQRAYVSGGRGQMVALLSPNGNFYWIHQDHLGSGRKMTDTSGNMIYRAEFDPYGKLLYEWSSSNQPNLNTKKFTGYERDTATGLDYAQARMYNSDWGRFMSPDPMGLGAASKASPKSLNRYSYVNGNPTNFRDPGGTCFYYWYQMSETYGYWDSMFCYDEPNILQPEPSPAGGGEPPPLEPCLTLRDILVADFKKDGKSVNPFKSAADRTFGSRNSPGDGLESGGWIFYDKKADTLYYFEVQGKGEKTSLPAEHDEWVALRDRFRREGVDWVFVAMYHTHPNGSPIPSGGLGDQKVLQNHNVDTGYGAFGIIITGVNRKGEVQFSFYNETGGLGFKEDDPRMKKCIQMEKTTYKPG